MKIVYKSDDGKEFDSVEECQKHESNSDIRKELTRIAEQYEYYCDGAGHSIMSADDCARMITENIDVIISIVKKDRNEIVYKANDNTDFNTELECIQHENELVIKSKDNEVKVQLDQLVKWWCECEDYEGYSSEDVANFIFLHFDKISEIVSVVNK